MSHTDERYNSRGIFFYAEFKKRVNSVAVILPPLSAKPTLGGLKKIAMDGSEFSSAFSMYSADAVSAMMPSRSPLCGAYFALEAVPADRSV
nr:DUF3137 domain-containing protein [uncultured Campylobacter sp.]